MPSEKWFRAFGWVAFATFAANQLPAAAAGSNTLTAEERASWQAVGATASLWASSASWSDWRGFSNAVFRDGQLPTWRAMAVGGAQRQAATALGFTAQTWGRLWAFRARMVHGWTKGFDWATDLSASERTALEELDTAGTWTGAAGWDDESAAVGTLETSWVGLTAAQQRAALALGFDADTWPSRGRLATETVRGCFWDSARMEVVLEKQAEAAVGEPEADGATRFNALCMPDSSRSNSHVRLQLQVGMPGAVPSAFGRAVTASMRSAGHAKAERSTTALVYGMRYVSDQERLPFPRGRPLLALHDPPGGHSFSSFRNVRAQTVMKKDDATVQSGFVTEDELLTGIKGESAETAACLGLGSSLCSNLPTKISFEAQQMTVLSGSKLGTVGKIDKSTIADQRARTTGHGQSGGLGGVSSYEHLDSSFEYEFSYSTSPSPSQAGPAADTFLMPTLQIKVTKVLKVQLDALDAPGSCATTASHDHHWMVMPHLSGFYFITAGDVERRVLPLLQRLTADAEVRKACKLVAADAGATPEAKLAACNSADCTAAPHLCRVSDAGSTANAGKAITTLELFCENQAGASVGPAYQQCLGSLPDNEGSAALSVEQQTKRLQSAKQNWEQTLERNYGLLRRIKGANEDPNAKGALDALCRPTTVAAAAAPFEPNTAGDLEQAICPMKGLAPRFLTDNALNFDGTRVGDTAEYDGYNVLTFGGGSSSLEYTYGLAGSVAETIESIDSASQWSFQGTTGPRFEARQEASLGLGVEGQIQLGGSRESVSMRTTLTQTNADSWAGFHFEDPDVGDYFTVQVFRDPYYGTPLFFTNGGASSCHHEANTALRAKPMLEAEYVGPDSLDPGQPAVFKVKVTNAIGYYEDGAAADRAERPLWVGNDLGYSPPNLALKLDPATVDEGLRLSVNGVPLTSYTLEEFGRGTAELLVEVRRGPGHYLYDSTLPTLQLAEECSDSDGERSAPVVLSMPGSTSQLRWNKPCVGVAWSGALLREQTFLVSGSESELAVQLSNPDLVDWADRDGLKLHLQYRKSGCLGAESECWTHIDDVAIGVPVVAEEDGSKHLRTVSVAWNTAGLDGRYDIRARTWCSAEGEGGTEAWTSTITGTIDTEAPSVIAAGSSSGDFTVAPTDDVRVLFSEPPACSGRHAAGMVIELSDDTTTLSLAAGDLSVRCDGATMHLSRTATGSAAILGSTEGSSAVRVTVNYVRDLAGNELNSAFQTTLAGSTQSEQIRALVTNQRLLLQEVAAIEAGLQRRRRRASGSTEGDAGAVARGSASNRAAAAGGTPDIRMPFALPWPATLVGLCAAQAVAIVALVWNHRSHRRASQAPLLPVAITSI